jgi:hypothetical protein
LRLRRQPPPLVCLVLVLFVIWGGIALAREIGAAHAGWDRRQDYWLPNQWRFGMAQVERLRRSLAGVEGWLPADSVVGFASPPGAGSADFFRWRWAAYLLPDLLVSPADDHEGWNGAAFLIEYGRLPAPPPGTTLEPSRSLGNGHLYRIHRP